MTGAFKRGLARLLLAIATMCIVFAHRWTRKQALSYIALALSLVEVEVAKAQTRHKDP